MAGEPVPIGDLAAALGFGDRETVALVGGGGKTTALFALGRQLAGSVILSTTTKMGSDRSGGYEPLLDPTASALGVALERDRVVLCWREISDHRVEGFSPERVDGWSNLADHVVIEADGSRRRPFKAPAPHEPVVPSSTTLLVACVGAAAFGAPIAAACHRPELVSALIGCDVDAPLDPLGLARVLLHDDGSRKGCPTDARFVVLLNRVTHADASFVADLADAVAGAAPILAVAPFGPGESPEP